MWYDAIIEKIKQFNAKVKEVEIKANSKNINNIVGHKRENLKNLKEVYDVDVQIVEDEKIKPGKFEIKVLKTYNDDCMNAK